MIVLQTPRLVLRHLTPDDAEFMLGMLNEPSYIQNIGDRGVRTVDEARQFLLQGPIDSYARHGHGLYRVEAKQEGIPIGLCGLLHREYLQEVDVGYAFVPAAWGRGYAVEAAAACLAYGREQLGLVRIVAVTTPENTRSIRVLEKIGLRYEKKVRLAADKEEIDLYA